MRSRGRGEGRGGGGGPAARTRTGRGSAGIQHYSAGLPYVLPFVALSSSVISTDRDPVYDTLVPVPLAVCQAAIFVRSVLEEYAETGSPLWPPVPSSLYDAFLAGDVGNAKVVVITWDSSVHGWGTFVRSPTNPEGKVIVSSLPSLEDMQHQVRQETLGGVLAFKAAARELDLSDSWVLMRNDCFAALAALCKGCSSSTFLQQCSMRLALLQRDAWCHTLYLHAPGS